MDKRKNSSNICPVLLKSKWVDWLKTGCCGSWPWMKRWHLWTACCPQVLPFKLTFPHQKNTCTQSIKSEGSCTDAYVFFFSVVVVVLSYTNYTLVWGTHPHTDDLNASDQNSRLLASLSHLSSSLCFSHSLRHTVFGELELKNKSLALSWQQCTYVWDMPSLLFCWKGFLMFLL